MLKEARDLLKRTFQEWKEDDVMQWGAGMAYYAALAMAPLIVLLLAIVSLVWQGPEAQARLMEMIQRQAGPQAAEVAAMVFGSEEDGDSGMLAGVLSTLLLLVGASGLFAHLQKALNSIWDVEPVKGGLRRLIRGRIIGFLLVLGLGLLLLVALVLQALLSALASGVWMSVLNQAGSVLLFTLVFGALFRTLPDVRIGWREVWVGAAATAILFTAGQLLVGLYLGRSSVGSRYGTAGTLVAFLVWLYYSAAVFFFGAELTQVGARRYGKGLEPEEGARRVRQVVVAEETGGPDAAPSTPPDRTRVSGEASYP